MMALLGLLLSGHVSAAAIGLPENTARIGYAAGVSRLTVDDPDGPTKAAVDAITSVLAKELAPKKIRVNAINPGMVETEGTHSRGIIGSDMEKKVVADTPLGRLGQPDDIAKVVTFVASADAGWVTGEVVRVSGGVG